MQDGAGRRLPAWMRSSALGVAGVMMAACAAGFAVASASAEAARGKVATRGAAAGAGAGQARGAAVAAKAATRARSGGTALAKTAARSRPGGTALGKTATRARSGGTALAKTATRARSVGTGLAKTASHPGPVDKADVGGRQLASHGIVVNQPATGSLALPKIRASAYVVADARTGAVLAAKDAHGLHPPASTLKVLTAITMLPLLKPGRYLTATKLAASAEPNIVGLKAGRMYKVSDLFNALLLISANDAAVALIQGSGSYAKGLALMNAQAHHLQAYDVVAKTPNGLPATGQVVSAYDLALIARRALAMPAFMRYDSRLTARFPYKRHKSETLVNQNYLLTKYRGGIGGKIGWTMAAGATYIGLARRNGVTLIVTILHAPSLTEIRSAEKLLDWGFAMDGKVRPVGQLVPPLGAPRSKPPARSGGPHSGATLTGAPTSSFSGTGAGLAAALCVLMLGAVALFRRRVIDTRRPHPMTASAAPAVAQTEVTLASNVTSATLEASATQNATLIEPAERPTPLTD